MIRGAVIWTPIFAVLTALAVMLLIRALDNGGAWFGFALCGLIGLLSGSLALVHWRDLFAEPIETTGMIQRKWRKSDFLFFFPGHYVKIGKRVFRVRKDIYLEMPEPGGWMYARHYPHSNALVQWRPVGEEEGQLASAAAERRADWRERAPDWGAQQERQTSDRPEAVDVPQFERDRDE